VGAEAETSEPLLSKKLYQTVRKADTENVDKALEVAGELLRRNFLPQAQEVERQAGKGIEEIRKGVEEAAESVLGNEAEALRLARSQLDELIRQVNDEIARAAGSGQQRGGDPNDPASSAANQQRRASAQSGRPGQRQGGDRNDPAGSAANQQRRASAQSGRPGQQQSGNPNDPASSAANQQRRAQSGRPGQQQGRQGTTPQPGRASANQAQSQNAQANSGRNPGQQPGSQPTPSQTPGSRNARSETGARNNPSGWGGGQRLIEQWGGINTTGPLTGEDFRQWSDRLRDVEEVLTRPRLRNEAARIRDRARAIRVEFKRHGKEPKWDLVSQQISKPLTELRKRLADELASLESREALVPIDRDPVPSRFAEQVRRYYENLGGGD